MSARDTARLSPGVTRVDITNYADMLAAMGSEARLRIMRLLLSAHPDGMVVGEIGADLGVTASTLSHHLDKLKNEGLVNVQREGTFLRYTANTKALERLLGFLYAECCTRNKAARPQKIVCCR
jgi:DNA-binding transcriptional ArsR family regulator